MNHSLIGIETRKYLFDIERAGNRLNTFVAGKTLAFYLGDDLLRSGVERQFEIIGEAVGQLAKIDSTVAEKIPDYRRLIAFRNILIHGYAEVDDELG